MSTPGALERTETVFDELHPQLRELLEEEGFTEPTPPQETAIPPVLEGRNSLVISPTGSGKTEAALLPVLDRLLREPPEGNGALHVTPLKALNRDLLDRVESWGDRLGLDIQVRHGDTPRSRRRKQSLNPPDLLIVTPETLQAVLTGERLREHLEDLSYVVVDEVHELAGSKRGVQLSLGLERLREIAGDFTRVGLSATVGNPEEVAQFLAGPGDVEVLEAEAAGDLAVEVTAPGGHRLKGLGREQSSHLRGIAEAVRDSDSALIFVNTRQFAEVLASRFNRFSEELDVNIEVHHGSLSKEARLEVEERFKTGELDGLVCTSSLELGIDVGHVDHVVQYLSPRQVTRLLQRAGRSGHSLGETSRATVVASTPDEVAEALVIARRAEEGLAEDVETPEAPGDVLANQVTGALLSGEHDEEDLHRAFERAHPYSGLETRELRAVTEQLRENRILARDDFKQSGKAYSYFYDNLSTIPDEKTYLVQNRVSGSSVGTLDEAFVTSFLEPGASFICRGETWRAIEIEDDTVTVEPVTDPSGAVPKWVGEEIPVPAAVAQEVGRLRREIAEEIRSDGDPRRPLQDYPGDEGAEEVLVEAVRRQVEGEYPVPTDRRVTVERRGEKLVVNAAFGHRANQALGRVLSSLLAARLGSSVGLEAGPYRIVLTPPVKLRATEVEELIRELEPEGLRDLLEASTKNSTLFRWVLLQVAKRFGAVSKNADREKVSLKRLADEYYDTPMGREALREITEERLDVEGAAKSLRRVKEGEVGLTTSGASPLGEPEEDVSGMVETEKPDLSVLKALKKRIMNDRVILFCVNCQDWTSRRKVKNVDEQPECTLCGSKMVAALKPWEDEEIELYRGGATETDEERRVERVHQNANIVLSSGKRGVIALAARGVGPTNAGRVLRKTDADEWEFYRRILERERHYAKTHSFWD